MPSLQKNSTWKIYIDVNVLWNTYKNLDEKNVNLETLRDFSYFFYGPLKYKIEHGGLN